jgi:predicted RNase H-like HicB family nuclease
MRFLHIHIQQDDGWLVAQALEEPGVVTQGRTLDEIVRNVREVVELMFDEKDAQLELIVPSGTTLGAKRQRSRTRKKTTKSAA